MLSILVSNPKGGCGKTTVATNLATAFANAGQRCWLADADRQGSSLSWLERRHASAPAIKGLDWGKALGAPPKKKGVLIIDAPAAIRSKKTEVLISLADVVVVPVMPSNFDQQTTAVFLDQVKALKPIRKNKKVVAVVRNRVRRKTRVARRLDLFMVGGGHQDLGGLPDRAIYTELSGQGLGIFDLHTQFGQTLQADWQALLDFIDSAANRIPVMSPCVSSQPNADKREFDVRPAALEDADAIASLCNQLARDSGEDGTGMSGEKVVADLLAPGSGFYVVVAESGAAVVGYALSHIAYETAHGAKGHYLSDLFVAPDARNRGIASALIAAVAAHAKDEGGEFIWWVEQNDSLAAKALYAKMANVTVPVTAYAATETRFTQLARCLLEK